MILQIAINNIHTFISQSKRKIEAREAIDPTNTEVSKSKKNILALEQSFDTVLNAVQLMDDITIKGIIQTVQQAYDLQKNKVAIHTIIDMDRMEINHYII